MGSGSKSQVVGYRYFAGIHYVIARAVEAILRVDVGEKTAWTGSVASGDIDIDAPNLHGGDEKEGGVDGTLTILDGNATQALDSYLSSKVPGDQPNYRGVTSGVWKGGLLSSRSPYPKPWRFLVKRTGVKDDLTTQWNSAQADIDGDMNPAHIIRETLTNTVWGLGISELDLDATSFTNAAQTLYDESFGLSFLWSDGDLSIQDFLSNVLAHVDGVLYVDPETGLFVFKLIREDYTVASLEEFGQDDISDVRGFVRTTPGEITTQLEVKYIDRNTWEPDSVILHNLAMSDVQGGNVPDKRDYLGITKRDLAMTVGTRELRGSSAMLAKCRIVGNRRMADLKPGDVFKMTWSPLNISQLVMRVMNIEYGTLQDGRVTIDVVEDVFGIDEALYTSDTSNWVDPYTAPADPAARDVLELPLWSVVRTIIPESQVPNLVDAAAYTQTLAKKPSQDSLNYDRQYDLGTGYESEGTGYFGPYGDLSANIDWTTTVITLTNPDSLDLVETGSYALINDEVVHITNVDTGLSQVTVERGVLDTLPTSHSLGDVMWFPEVNQVVVERELSDGDLVNFKPLVRTGEGTLAIGSATAASRTMEGRAAMPFPPGHFRVNDGTSQRTYNASGVYNVLTSATDLDFLWRHRDRLQQTSAFVDQNDSANYGPEAGTTYTLRFKTIGGTVVRTVSGIVANTYTYTAVDQTVDFGVLPTSFKVELESVRNSITSYQTWDVQVDRSL